MSTSSVVHFVLLIAFAAVVGWLWRGQQLERRAYTSEPRAAQAVTSSPIAGR